MNNTFKIITGFALLNMAHVAEAAHLTKEADNAPNIIIFLTDDMGWGDMGVYGHSTIKTPHLDKFASEGMLFTNCHSASAVCSPSRASILTGRTSYRCGFFSIHREGQQYPHIRETEITLPEVLKTKGYATCHVGKWHLGSLKPEMKHPSPAAIGYDYWLATQSNAKPSHLNPVNFYRNGKPVGEMKGFSSEIIVDEAIHWLESNQNEAPFFLSVWTHEPHTPIGTDKRFLELYDEALDPVVREYYGNISQLDYAFGKLMKWLERKGIKNNTLVIFASDNGPAWAQNHLDRIHESSG
ncbi:MAG: sulfatase, partial [Bacteroidota bacterium]